MENSQLHQSWWSLRITYGLVAFLAGLDKFFHLLTNWDNYLSPIVASLVPVSIPTLMHVVGVIEMGVGLLILTRWTRLGAYIASLWLLCIAVNIVLTGSFLDVAVRDVALSVGAWTLARLSEAYHPEPRPVPSSAPPAHV
jgi:uncharacterized membrane protein YphA (DoxX/SURF4 family)